MECRESARGQGGCSPRHAPLPARLSSSESNEWSLDARGQFISMAVAAMKRSNGSRCCQSSAAALDTIACVSGAESVCRSAKSTSMCGTIPWLSRNWSGAVAMNPGEGSVTSASNIFCAGAACNSIPSRPTGALQSQAELSCRIWRFRTFHCLSANRCWRARTFAYRHHAQPRAHGDCFLFAGTHESRCELGRSLCRSYNRLANLPRARLEVLAHDLG